MSASTEKPPSGFHRWKGTIKKYLGWTVDDRQTEAKGVAEVREGSPPSEESLAQAHHDVKRSYDEAGLIDRADAGREKPPVD